MTKNKFRKTAKFPFKQVTLVGIRGAIKYIRLIRSSCGDISAGILKQCDFCFQVLTNFINKSIVSEKFPNSLKLANISQVCNAKDTLNKTNYRPVIVLPLLLKMYED